MSLELVPLTFIVRSVIIFKSPSLDVTTCLHNLHIYEHYTHTHICVYQPLEYLCIFKELEILQTAA